MLVISHLAVRLDAGPILTVKVLSVTIALPPPDLNAYGVQPKLPCFVSLNFLLKSGGNLQNKGCQRSKYLPGWEVLVQKALQSIVTTPSGLY